MDTTEVQMRYIIDGGGGIWNATACIRKGLVTATWSSSGPQVTRDHMLVYWIWATWRVVCWGPCILSSLPILPSPESLKDARCIYSRQKILSKKCLRKCMWIILTSLLFNVWLLLSQFLMFYVRHFQNHGSPKRKAMESVSWGKNDRNVQAFSENSWSWVTTATKCDATGEHSSRLLFKNIFLILIENSRQNTELKC